MQNVLSNWSGLDPGRKIASALAVIALVASVWGIARMATKPTMALLYAGLDSAAASEVLNAVDGTGVAYEIRGDAIFVEQTARDRLRLTLAGQGLPAQGSTGYELLDSLPGFGTTSQMFDAAQWRAIEGELARTITGGGQYRAARVHLSRPDSRLFSRTGAMSASVVLTPAGGAVTAGQADALRHLVAAAVSGLSSDAVAVIDARSGRLVAGDTIASAAGEGQAQADNLRAKAANLLDALVGPGNSVVEVSVDTDTTSERVFQRTIDPDSRVAISTERSETTSQAEGQGSGAVTVASNLPAGDTGGSGSSQTSRNVETRETSNYEISETSREMTRSAGQVKRLTVAVLVAARPVTAADGTTSFEARADEELAQLRELVSAAVGADESRGDIVTVRSMQLAEAPAEAEVPAPGLLDGIGPLDISGFVRIGILSAVALILGLFVVRPILTRPGNGAQLSLPQPRSEEDGALNGDLDFSDLPDLGDLPVVSDFAMPDIAGTGGSGSSIARLKDMVSDREGDAMDRLRAWIGDGRSQA